MRDYAKVSPKFWTGESGKKMRGQVEAQIVAMYLMSSPHSDMTGVYTCPMIYIAYETGLGMEGASKGLQRLIETDFCTYEEVSETVFVHEMAKYQIGEELKVNDNQVKSVKKAYASMKGVIRERFFARYHISFHLEGVSPFEAPSKPLRSQEQEQKQEQKQEQAQASVGAVTAAQLSIAMRKAGVNSQPADPRLIAFAEQGVSVETVEAACSEAKKSKPNESIGVGYVAKILERWAREASELKAKGAVTPKREPAWWLTPETKLAKAMEVGVGPANLGESNPAWEARIRAAIDNGGKPPVHKQSPPVTVMAAEPKRIEVELSAEEKAHRSQALKAALSRASA